MSLFEPKTTIYYGEDPEQLSKVTQLMQQHDIKYKCIAKGAGTEVRVPRSKGDEGEYPVREMKQGRMR